MKLLPITYLLGFIVPCTLLAQLSMAQDSMVIAVIGKTKNDSFYE